MLVRIALLASMIAAVVAGAPAAQADDLTATDITFARSDATTTHGTVHAPAGATGLPGVVLVHGSGTAKSPQYDQVATALAREGIVALRYDKRTEDYTPAQQTWANETRFEAAGVRGSKRLAAGSSEALLFGSFDDQVRVSAVQLSGDVVQ